MNKRSSAVIAASLLAASCYKSIRAPSDGGPSDADADASIPAAASRAVTIPQPSMTSAPNPASGPPANINVQSRTKQAADYAKVASRENPIYAQKAAGTSKNAYNIAFRDWQRPPVIDRIQCYDGHVQVSAHDDTMVARVTVAILDEAGQYLEQGEAELVMGVWWNYKAAHQGRIQVEAWDLAGNITRQEFSPSTPLLSVWEKPVGAKKF